MSKLMMSIGVSALFGAASTLILAGFASEAHAQPIGSAKRANFTIGPNCANTWTIACNAAKTQIHIGFEDFTNMKLEVLAGETIASDLVPGAFYQCSFSHQGMVTIRLTNLGNESFSGRINVR